MRYIEPVVVRAAPRKWIFMPRIYLLTGMEETAFFGRKMTWTFLPDSLDFLTV
jgi:hypothetical protein